MTKILRRVLFAALVFVPMEGVQAADDLSACRLPEMHILGDVGLGFPRIAARLNTLGKLRVRVLFVDFSDVPARRTPRQMMDLLSPRAEQFFHAVSYGKLTLSFDPDTRWIRMSRRSGDYHFWRGAPFAVQQAFMQEAVDLAGPLNFADADAILVMSNPEAQAIDWGPAFAAMPGSGILAGGRVFLNGATSGSDVSILGWTWFVHEFGHAMSLVDLAGPLPDSGLWHTYVGDFSAMGNPLGAAPEYLGWERWQLGWLDDAQVRCVTENAVSVALAPIERAGGLQLAIVPTGKTTAVVVESRRPEGFDEHLPRAGALVYVVDTRRSTHDGAIRVQPVDPKDERHWRALLEPGQAVRADGVEVMLVSQDGQGDIVHIRRLTP